MKNKTLLECIDPQLSDGPTIAVGANLDTRYVIQILWDDAIHETSGTMEDIHEYRFTSQEEIDAFVDGVEAGLGKKEYDSIHFPYHLPATLQLH
jgi:hypothetical protein